MKFYNYINNITINLTKQDDGDIKEFLHKNNLLEETQKLIDDLNDDLFLNRNKEKFKLTEIKNIPTLKNHDQTKVIDKWLNTNEKFTSIKKSFLKYMDDKKIK